MRIARSAVFLLSFAAATACRPSEVADASVGEVVVVVDTDMPVPAVVSRLRLDLYDERGVWYATRDVERGRASDWPTSFGVNVSAEDGEKVVLLRLRAYPERGTRDYRGERFEPRLAPPSDDIALDAVPLPAATGEPRLRDELGTDVTPAVEPQPLLAIDRLVRVRVRVGQRLAAHVVLHGACVGTMADVAHGTTCVDREGPLVPAGEEALDDRRALPATSLAGSFDPGGSCTAAPRSRRTLPDGTPLFDAEICVPGAMFRFGTPDGVFGEADALPERFVVVNPFLLDENEVTVGRFRDAIARGFVPPDASPVVNDAPIPSAGLSGADEHACTWSTQPLGRETFALSCVTWKTARAFCMFEGGDLPTEAEWEYAALSSGRPYRSRFAWGGADDAVPTCARAVWGRADLQYSGQLCIKEGVGPLPVDAHVGPDGDRTPTLAILGMSGSVAEYARDAFAPLTARCWAAQPLVDPVCDVPSAARHTLRGGTWHDNAGGLLPGARRRENQPSAGDGFRCMRPGRPGAAR